jgi:pseudouridine synthase
MERLNKVLARAGIASRRGADELIAQGRISVNGAVVRDMGVKVDPDRDDIRLDGEQIPGPQALRYVALHKPRHVITTRHDPAGRPTVCDLVPEEWQLFPVGRLDGSSEGLLVMTNDGELANVLTHPSYAHEKEYRVKISGTPSEATLRTWREGMYLEDGRTSPARVVIESSTGAGTWLRFTLREGRNRQIRRMVEGMHHRVHRIIRVRIGGLELGDLPAGHWRELSPLEVELLLSGEAARSGRASTKADSKPRYKPGWARPKLKARRRHRRPRSSRRGGPRRGRGPGKAADR